MPINNKLLSIRYAAVQPTQQGTPQSRPKSLYQPLPNYSVTKIIYLLFVRHKKKKKKERKITFHFIINCLVRGAFENWKFQPTSYIDDLTKAEIIVTKIENRIEIN